VIRDLVGRIRTTRDYHHDDELLAPKWLEVGQGGQERKEGNDEDRRPKRKGLKVPRERRWSVAAIHDVH